MMRNKFVPNTFDIFDEFPMCRQLAVNSSYKIIPDYAQSSSGSPLVVKNTPLGHDETAEAAGKRYRTPDWTPILRGKAAVFPNMSFVRNQEIISSLLFK